MEHYEKIKNTFKRYAITADALAEHLAEDPHKKKKRKKKSKKTEEDDMIISFKPLGTCKLKDSQDSRQNPLPNEKEFCEKCPIKFYNIQIEAIRWMYWIERSKKNEQHVGGILGDVMGLGKTMDGLGITAYDYFEIGRPLYEKKPTYPTLIVTTLTLIHQWRSELVDKFKYPENDVLIYHGAKRYEDYEHMYERGIEPLIIITNYETVQKDYEDSESILFKTYWMRILLDEAHIARNPKTNTYHALKALHANAKWCITGTPIVNYPDDIRRLSQLCTPCFPLNYGSSLQESRWKSLFLLRRTKEMLPLPPLQQGDIWLELSENEKKNYSKLEMWAQNIYDELVSTHTLNQKYQKILLVLVRLRQECDHFLLQQGYYYTSKILEIVKQRYGIEDVFTRKKYDISESDEDEYNYMDYDDSFEQKRTSKKKKKQKSIINIEKANKNVIIKSPKEKKEEEEKQENYNNQFDSDYSSENDQSDENDENTRDVGNAVDTGNTGNAGNAEDVEDNKNEKNKEKDKKETEKLYNEDKIHEFAEFFENSTKLNYIRDFIQSIFQKDSVGKIVIFTQFTTMLDLIEIVLIKSYIKTLRFDGRVQKADVRKKIIELFNTDSQYRVILTSLKAGGVGLNLVAANYLLLVDPWWNRSVELQAFDRVHRIGQKNPVTVYRLLIKGSIEEEVLKIQEKKNNQENSFYDMFSEKVLSIKDIHCVFNTMRVRQLKNNKQS